MESGEQRSHSDARATYGAARVLAHDLEASPAGRPIWEVIADNMKRVPAEDLASMPQEGASQIDHYVYGVPKRTL